MLVTYSVTTFAKSFLVMSRTKTRFVFWFLRQAVPCPGPPLPRSRHPWADSGVLGSLLLSRPTSRPRPAWGPPWSAAESVPSHPDCVLRPPPRSHTARAHPTESARSPALRLGRSQRSVGEGTGGGAGTPRPPGPPRSRPAGALVPAPLSPDGVFPAHVHCRSSLQVFISREPSFTVG